MLNNPSLMLSLLVSALALAPLHTAWAMEQAERPAVGSPAPDAPVVAADGSATTLHDVFDTGPTVLVFYRGGWCPYCTRQLAGLMDIHDELQTRGYQIVGIAPQSAATIAATTTEHELGFQLLADEQVAAARAFGLAFAMDQATLTRYAEYGIDTSFSNHVLPHPAVFVIRDGTIQFVHIDEDYRARLSNADLLAAALPVVD